MFLDSKWHAGRRPTPLGRNFNAEHWSRIWGPDAHLPDFFAKIAVALLRGCRCYHMWRHYWNGDGSREGGGRHRPLLRSRRLGWCLAHKVPSVPLDAAGNKNKLIGLSPVITALSLPQTCVALAVANPLAVPDHQIALWFHSHLSRTFVTFLRVLSEPGSSQWVGLALGLAVLFFLWRRAWPAIVTLVVAVPGGMLLNELIKISVQRHRPYLEGAFVDWSGYSFASGHTIGATLLYGQLVLFLLPLLKSRHWKGLTILVASGLIVSVGFSRIALGAHYLSDVLAAVVLGIFWLAVCLLISKPIRRRSLSGPLLPPDLEPAVVPVRTD
jgi:membrane-associated phospholipid phosphatase